MAVTTTTDRTPESPAGPLTSPLRRRDGQGEEDDEGDGGRDEPARAVADPRRAGGRAAEGDRERGTPDDRHPTRVGRTYGVEACGPADDEESETEADEHPGQPAEPRAGGEQQGERGRPQEVEVLLDGERPRVLEQRGGMAEVDPPVRHVGERGEAGRPDLAEPPGDEPERDDTEARGDERRVETQDPAHVEPRQRDAPRALVLAQDEGGDEEAAEDEEDVHAREAVGERAEGRVEEHDGDRRGTPQAVEPAPVTATRGLAHLAAA